MELLESLGLLRASVSFLTQTSHLGTPQKARFLNSFKERNTSHRLQESASSSPDASVSPGRGSGWPSGSTWARPRPHGPPRSGAQRIWMGQRIDVYCISNISKNKQHGHTPFRCVFFHDHSLDSLSFRRITA